MTLCSSSPKVFSFPQEQELMTASHISLHGMLSAIAFASSGVAAPSAASWFLPLSTASLICKSKRHGAT